MGGWLFAGLVLPPHAGPGWQIAAVVLALPTLAGAATTGRVSAHNEPHNFGSQPDDRLPIIWLHVQKTGSGLGNTLLRWACFNDMQKPIVKPGGGYPFPRSCARHFARGSAPPETPRRKKWPIGDHYRLAKASNALESMMPHVVTLLRHPAARTISHFTYYYRFRALFRNTDDHALISKLRRKLFAIGCKNLRESAGCYGGISNYGPTDWQASAVTGEQRNASGDEACNRAQKFGLVGITEMTSASVCLFYHTYGAPPLNGTAKHARGPMSPAPFELQPVRAHSAQLYDRNQHAAMLRALGDVTGWPDYKLYDCAIREFAKRVRGTPCAEDAARAITKLTDPANLMSDYYKGWRELFVV